MLLTKNEIKTNGNYVNHNCREQLLREYQVYLENIEQAATQQIALIKKASSLEIKAMFQRLAVQEGETLSSQAEAENTELITLIAGKAVAWAVDSGIDRVIPLTVNRLFFKEAAKRFPIQWEVLKLTGLDCQKLQSHQEAVKRNCLIGAVINFKLKLLSVIRQDYANQCRALEFQHAEAEVDFQIA